MGYYSGVTMTIMDIILILVVAILVIKLIDRL